MNMESSMTSSMASSMATMAATSMGNMAMGTQTSMAGAMPSATAAMGDSMDMGMGMGSCKIDMLWNWNTVDACFISRSWHITSKGMFAGSCIGVILLVCSLEFLRRVSREYDRYIAFTATQTGRGALLRGSLTSTHDVDSTDNSKNTSMSHTAERSPDSSQLEGGRGFLASIKRPSPVRLTLLQQSIRAILHMFQFGVAYFIMLLAMYYNGYIIICILLGALIGSFIFSWDFGSTEVAGCCGE